MRNNNHFEMLNSLTPDVILTNIHMTRKKTKNKAFVLVEGTTDTVFYKGIICNENVQIIPARSKSTVIKTIRKANALKIKGILAIVDSDYDIILDSIVEDDNIVYTDTHDIETLILQTDAFDRFINEFGDDDKILQYEQKKGEKILNIVLEYGGTIGKLRLLSVKEGYNLCFNSIRIEEYFDSNLEFNFTKYFKQVIYVSKKLNIKEEILDKYSKLGNNYDIWQLCRGHDLSEIISVLFSGDGNSVMLGNSRATHIGIDRVEQSLRFAYYAPIHFISTKMYKAILEWQSKNSGFILIKINYKNSAA